MSPETHQPPDSSELETKYEINTGDVLFVSRNMKNPDGTPLLDDEGAQMKKLEDGWEVVTLNGINPTNGREGIMLRNTNDPDELKFYSDRQLRAIQEQAESEIMSRARNAAADLLGETNVPYESEPEIERHEELVLEASQDMGREATEDVVESPSDAVETSLENSPQEIAEELSPDERDAALRAAIFEFRRRESYSAEELQSGLSRALRSYEDGTHSARSAMYALQSLETVQRELSRAVSEYDESIQQMGGRPNPDYDPRVVLYRRIEQHTDTLHHAKRAISRVSEQDMGDIRRANESLTTTLHEVSHEIDKDESNAASYLLQLQETQGIEVPEAPKSKELREFLGKVDAPLSAIKEKSAALDTLAVNTDADLNGLIRELDTFMANVQHGIIDRDSFSRIQRVLTDIGSEDKIQEFSVHANALNLAIEDMPRRIPELGN